MKRIFLVLALVAVLVVSLALGGCTSAYTKKQTDTAINAAVEYVLDQMPDGVAGPAGPAGPTGPTGPSSTTDVEDLNFYDLTDDQIEDLRDILGVEEWWDEDEDEDNDNGNGSTSGEVTITLDGATPLEVSTDTWGASPGHISVTVTNGTEDWWEVRYCVNFTCTLAAGNAKVTDAKLAASSSSFGAGEDCFNVSYVPDAGKAWQVIFTPKDKAPGVVAFKVRVSPGKAITMYHAITLKTEGFALWEVTLFGVTETKL